MRSPLHRWPVGLILLGRILTSIAFALDITQHNPVAPMDPTILAATFSAAMYSLALFRFRLFDVVPLARNTIIEWMADGILVLDAEHHIADLNSAAQQLLGVARAQTIGLAAGRVLSAFPDLLELSRAAATAQIEMTLKVGDASRCYQVSSSPLIDRRGHQLGQVLTLHNITEVKQAQERLLQQQRLLATLQERDRVARELHDSLGQVLGYVKMQAQAARGLLARDQLEEADRYLAQLVTLWHRKRMPMCAPISWKPDRTSPPKPVSLRRWHNICAGSARLIDLATDLTCGAGSGWTIPLSRWSLCNCCALFRKR